MTISTTKYIFQYLSAIRLKTDKIRKKEINRISLFIYIILVLVFYLLKNPFFFDATTFQNMHQENLDPYLPCRAR